MWRVLTHERNRASLHEVQELWSLVDLVHANIALDLVDDLARKSHREARRREEMDRLRSKRR